MAWKRSRQAVRLWMICGLLCCVLAFRCERISAGETQEIQKVQISVVCGYEGYGKFGRYIPVKAELISAESRSGIFQIIVPGANGTGNYAYEYPVSLEAGISQQIRADIPLMSNYTQFHMEFIGDDGIIYAVTTPRVNTPAGQITELFVGVLSVEEEAYQAFQGVNIGEFTNSGFPYVVTRSFSLHIGDITDSVYGLNSLDIIVSDAKTYEMLSEQQKTMLHNWVHEGGVFMLEIEDDTPWFSRDDQSVSEPLEVRPVFWVQTKEEGDGIYGYIWIGSDEIDMIRYMLEDSRDVAGAVVGTVCSSEKISSIEKKDHRYEGWEMYQSVSQILEGNVLNKIPKINVYVVVIIIYLILTGPVLHILLRRWDKVEWTRRAMMLLAFGFSAAIYLIGHETRFKGPFLQYATILELSGEQIKEETAFAMRAPSHTAYAINFDNSYFMKPVSSGNYYYYENVITDKSFADYKTSIYQGIQNIEIVVRQAAPFQAQYFFAEKYEPNENNMEIVSDLIWFNDELFGSITNQTGRKLISPVVLIRNIAYIFPDLEQGETGKVEEAEIVYYSPNSYDLQAQRIVGLKGMDQLGTGNNQTLFRRTKLLGYYLMQLSDLENTGGKVIAFLEEGSSFAKENDILDYGVCMISAEIVLETGIYDDYVYETFTSKNINNVDSDPEYHAIHHTTTGNSIRLEYQLGKIDNLKNIRFSDCIVEEGNQEYRMFHGDIFFYNPNTYKFERIDLSKRNFSVNEITSYLSVDKNGNYSLVVMYMEPVSQSGGQQIRLPVVSAIRKKGR